jgi:hypothetical protein
MESQEEILPFYRSMAAAAFVIRLIFFISFFVP